MLPLSSFGLCTRPTQHRPLEPKPRLRHQLHGPWIFPHFEVYLQYAAVDLLSRLFWSLAGRPASAGKEQRYIWSVLLRQASWDEPFANTSPNGFFPAILPWRDGSLWPKQLQERERKKYKNSASGLISLCSDHSERRWWAGKLSLRTKKTKLCVIISFSLPFLYIGRNSFNVSSGI